MQVINENIPKYIGFKHVWTLPDSLLMYTYAMPELIAPKIADVAPKLKNGYSLFYFSM